MNDFDSMFLTHSLSSGNGYVYSLTTQLGCMLQTAERLYGARDHSWTILGIEYNTDPNANPQIWYPGDCKNIAIQLVDRAMTNKNIAYFQLAHETIHLLAPSGGQNANVLEEGLAAHFAVYYLKTYMEEQMCNVSPSYIYAQEKVEELLNADADAIKKLRAITPHFYQMTRDTFARAHINIPVASQDELLKRF